MVSNMKGLLVLAIAVASANVGTWGRCAWAGDPVTGAVSRSGTVFSVDPLTEVVSRIGTVFNTPPLMAVISRAGTIFNVPPSRQVVSRSGTVLNGEVAAIDPALEVPRVTELIGASPNPFNPSTKIRYALAEVGQVTIRIYGSDGRLVRSLVGGPQPPGFYTIEWDGRDLRGQGVASGVYHLRMTAPGMSRTMKLVQLK